MTNAVVHWEIGGPNLSELRDFYAKSFGWTIDDAGDGYRNAGQCSGFQPGGEGPRGEGR
ncbi:putative enzyme related to lactoylglutathione lyase [Actinoplanes octamycinicus]|uniref:Putative enzyme related to lactoylglutathione lyase n=1 Tax=Actinoplanes octamycinicus TaxID=135948 RepID=A0A7W7MA96_9ACTN|nr:hypothetical protein [Actinoplanes octamycinicus]MBB4742757.1 putative enzyme related to lactoylglutathione lyase [Actinoplanes octamycinicus]